MGAALAGSGSARVKCLGALLTAMELDGEVGASAVPFLLDRAEALAQCTCQLLLGGEPGAPNAAALVAAIPRLVSDRPLVSFYTFDTVSGVLTRLTRCAGGLDHEERAR